MFRIQLHLQLCVTILLVVLVRLILYADLSINSKGIAEVQNEQKRTISINSTVS